MKKLLLLLIVPFLFTSVNAQQTTCNSKKALMALIKVSGNNPKTRGGVVIDSNVVTGIPTDDTKALPPEKDRGILCPVKIDNNSGYAFQVYFNGQWKGTVAAYSSSMVFSRSGSITIYFKSVGEEMYWGPETLEDNTDYTITLKE
jgi:hypothetical protein